MANNKWIGDTEVSPISEYTSMYDNNTHTLNNNKFVEYKKMAIELTKVKFQIEIEDSSGYDPIQYLIHEFSNQLAKHLIDKKYFSLTKDRNYKSPYGGDIWYMQATLPHEKHYKDNESLSEQIQKELNKDKEVHEVDISNSTKEDINKLFESYLDTTIKEIKNIMKPEPKKPTPKKSKKKYKLIN